MVGCRDASKAINTYPVPLQQENSNENKKTSQTVPEEEPSSDNDNTFNLDDTNKDNNMNFGPIS